MIGMQNTPQEELPEALSLSLSQLVLNRKDDIGEHAAKGHNPGLQTVAVPVASPMPCGSSSG